MSLTRRREGAERRATPVFLRAPASPRELFLTTILLYS